MASRRRRNWFLRLAALTCLATTGAGSPPAPPAPVASIPHPRGGAEAAAPIPQATAQQPGLRSRALHSRARLARRSSRADAYAHDHPQPGNAAPPASVQRD